MGVPPVSLQRHALLGHNFLVAHPVAAVRKQPIVFIHGMSGFAAYLGDAMTYAAKLGFTSYAHDITGHGERHGEDVTGKGVLDYVDDSADFINKIVRTRHAAPIVLVGHSMGGLIAAKLAEKRDDIGHVILVTPAPPSGVMFLPGGLVRVSVRDVLSALVMAVGGKNFIPSRRFLDSLFADPLASRHIIDVWEKRRLSNESLLAALQLGLSQVAIDPKKISAPMFVIGAKKDVVVHPSVAGRVARFFGAELHMHEQLGHMCPFEAGWEENSRVISEWLVRHNVR